MWNEKKFSILCGMMLTIYMRHSLYMSYIPLIVSWNNAWLTLGTSPYKASSVMMHVT